ncbi:AraC family transcriptional regulator [[Clostridium] polysaccharolyticum]|uniref:AraC-type DNA-binding protein n=1 Tax=[Clostridium] polysaccharolyticum TaxID=29364 RepID=A0A1I0FQ23_9FIRM|nr:AraC family transcriptional regulator [[Clostridium] polysaccharolyticum]SET60551.1 AraC-type DNA-binding protein [[Clostridium] polysaccharolyticum]
MNKYDITENDFNPTVLFASKSKLVEDGYYHDHDYTEITVILSGTGKYYIEGKNYDVKAGDVIMCNPGVMHQSLEANEKEPIVEFVAGFTHFHFTGMPENSILLNDNEFVLRMPLEGRQEIMKRCYEMVAEYETSHLGKYFMLKAQLMQIILLILREMQPVKETQKSYRFESYNKNYVVKKIISYLNENYACKISLDQIAQNLYLSPVYISKLFKEETGESPINYLIKIRLNRAKELLEREEHGSIRSVASEVGYEDVYHFSKLFKKYYGISPLNYSKKFSRQKQ